MGSAAAQLAASWIPGTKVVPSVNTMDTTTLNVKAMTPGAKYRFGISAVVPRPIALVSTRSAAGVNNLAPFSYCGLMCHDPMVLSFCPVTSRAKPSARKDSLRNIAETGDCVVHIVSDWMVAPANHASGDFEDELATAGFTAIPSVHVAPPRVGEAAVQLECKLLQLVPIHNATGDEAATIVLVEVVLAHVAKDVYNADDGVIVAEKLRPIARLGGNTYGELGALFDLPRPQ